MIGGAFSVLLDLHHKPYVWGANTNGELGVGDNQPRTYPTVLESLEDKVVTQVGVGSSFAFVLGQNLNQAENYQTYLTEEPMGTLMTNDNRHFQSQVSEGLITTEQNEIVNLKFDPNLNTNDNRMLNNQVYSHS